MTFHCCKDINKRERERERSSVSLRVCVRCGIRAISPTSSEERLRPDTLQKAFACLRHHTQTLGRMIHVASFLH